MKIIANYFRNLSNFNLNRIWRLPNAYLAVTQTHPEALNIFKDSYLVEFLDLPESHSEADLHQGLLAKLKQFLLELGRDFCFVGSQYPIQVGKRDFALDLLFFHRGLNALVVIDILCGAPHNKSYVAKPY